jgi:hypothetical protein
MLRKTTHACARQGFFCLITGFFPNCLFSSSFASRCVVGGHLFNSSLLYYSYGVWVLWSFWHWERFGNWVTHWGRCLFGFFLFSFLFYFFFLFSWVAFLFFSCENGIQVCQIGRRMKCVNHFLCIRVVKHALSINYVKRTGYTYAHEDQSNFPLLHIGTVTVHVAGGGELPLMPRALSAAQMARKMHQS